jgi:hypothetical protein
MDSVPELNTKNLGNSPRFLTITDTTLSAKRFRSYDVSKFDFTAEFCFWTEQWLSGTQLSGLGLTKTLEVINTIMVDNSHLSDSPSYRPNQLVKYELRLSETRPVC